MLGFVVLSGLSGTAYALSRLSLPPPFPQPQTTVLTDANGRPLARLSGGQNRQPVRFDQIPKVVIDAVVTTEDHNFFHHRGVDPLGIARAALSDLLGHGTLQGASTLTQQYIKNAYLGQQRTFSRKVEEAMLALKLERQLTKDQILERYLNTIYFGRGAYGIQAAAQVYFKTDVGNLNLGEAAFLAGAIRAPEYADPVRDPVTARARRDTTLRDMVRYHKITAAQAAAAAAGPVEANPYTPADQTILAPAAAGAAYFVSYVTQRLIASYGENIVYGGGLRVRTSIDLRMQQDAYQAVYGDLVTPSGPAGALISVDSSGAIKAMVGGRDYHASQVNLAVGAEGGGSGRQPGSTMKAVLLAEIVREHYSVLSTFRAPAEIKLLHANNGQDWTVKNFAGEDFSGPDGSGTINLIDATKSSVNTVYAQAVTDIGPRNMANMGYRLGLGVLPPYASIVLGSVDESVLGMAGAYSVFMDGGVYNQPHAILEVRNARGVSMPLQLSLDKPTGLDKADTDIITHVLRQVVVSGTGTAAAFRIPVAGKTGTADANTDAWFIGYTPQPGLTTAVWMGYPDRSRPMTDIYGINGGVTGGSLPADIFRRFMSQALVGAKTGSFTQPSSFPGKMLGQPVDAVFPPPSTTSTVPGPTTTAAGTRAPTTTSPGPASPMATGPGPTTTRPGPGPTVPPSLPPVPATTVVPPGTAGTGTGK